MLIDEMDLDSCIDINEILELCLSPMKKLMTQAEQDEIKSIVRKDDEALIKELVGTIMDIEVAHKKAQETMLDNYLRYHLVISAKACILHVYPRRNYTDDDAFFLIGSYYTTVIEFALQLTRQSSISKSLSSNNNGLKSASTSGRSITFMTHLEVAQQTELPQAIKQRLPRPYRTGLW